MLADAQNLFTEDTTRVLFPAERTEAFFDALFGDAEEGAYTIELVYRTQSEEGLEFAFILTEKPGKCLACNLTYGLPQVFSRHPIINVAGMVKEIAKIAGWDEKVVSWELGKTREESSNVHVIPLMIRFA